MRVVMPVQAGPTRQRGLFSDVKSNGAVPHALIACIQHGGGGDGGGHAVDYTVQFRIVEAWLPTRSVMSVVKLPCRVPMLSCTCPVRRFQYAAALGGRDVNATQPEKPYSVLQQGVFMR